MNKLIPAFLIFFSIQCKGQRRDIETENKWNSGLNFNWIINKEKLNYCISTGSDMMNEIPEVLAVDIAGVKNGNLIPVYIKIYFKLKGIEYDVGNFTLYPADKPSSFRFRIPDKLSETLKDNKEKGSAELCFFYISENETVLKDSDSVEMNISVKGLPDTEIK